MQKPGTSIGLRPTDYAALRNLGLRVVENMTANIYFSAPSPALSALQNATNLVTAALALRGNVHSHGSTEDMMDLRVKALALHQLLTAEADYVRNRAQLSAGSDYALMAGIIASSGFSLKRERQTQGLPEPVRNLHRFFSLSLNQNQVKIVWEDPLNVTSRNNIKARIIFRGSTPVFSQAEQVDTVSKNEYIDSNDTDAPITWYYWVIAVGAAGNGALSEMLMVKLPGA